MVTTSSLSFEFSKTCALQNPELFVKSLFEWYQKVEDNDMVPTRTNVSRGGFITYYAENVKTAIDTPSELV